VRLQLLLELELLLREGGRDQAGGARRLQAWVSIRGVELARWWSLGLGQLLVGMWGWRRMFREVLRATPLCRLEVRI